VIAGVCIVVAGFARCGCSAHRALLHRPIRRANGAARAARARRNASRTHRRRALRSLPHRRSCLGSNTARSERVLAARAATRCSPEPPSPEATTRGAPASESCRLRSRRGSGWGGSGAAARCCSGCEDAFGARGVEPKARSADEGATATLAAGGTGCVSTGAGSTSGAVWRGRIVDGAGRDARNSHNAQMPATTMHHARDHEPPDLQPVLDMSDSLRGIGDTEPLRALQIDLGLGVLPEKAIDRGAADIGFGEHRIKTDGVGIGAQCASAQSFLLRRRLRSTRASRAGVRGTHPCR